VIVVDDGDGAGAAVARQLAHNQLRIFSTGGTGQVAARNLGVSQARGRWIAFLDDDDWWADGCHLKNLCCVLSDRSLAYASGRIWIETSHTQPSASILFDAFMDHRSVCRDNTLLVPGIAYPRQFHDALGPFDERLPYYWDWDWYLRLAAAGIVFNRSSGTAVRVTSHPQNVSGENNQADRRNNLAHLVDKHRLIEVSLKNHLSIAREFGLTSPVSTTCQGRPAPHLTFDSDPRVDRTPY
jgi:glycosyltransferase involved in cell wall biosynthesis